MASTYAHYKFAKEVLSLVPSNIQHIISSNKQVYNIGCHGPDLFFYHKPLSHNEVSDFGHSEHEVKANIFFSRCATELRKNFSDDRLSYIFGFITHFALDSSVHGYVERKARSVTNTDFDHGTIEVEFDRFLLVQEGKNPVRSSIIGHLVANDSNAKTVASFFPNIGLKKTKKALKSIIFYNNLLNSPQKLKRAIVLRCLKIVGKYDDLHTQIISYNGNPLCDETNTELMRRFSEALPLAVKLIENFYAVIKEGSTLDERFNKTFSWEDNE